MTADNQQDKQKPELSTEKVAQGLIWLNSLVSRPEDYRRLTTAANELGIVVRNYLSSETSESKIDGIISYVVKSDPDNYLLEFFVHAAVMDQETLKSGDKKELAVRAREAISYMTGSVEVDDSVRSLGLGIESLLDLYDRMKESLSEQERAMLREKISKLGVRLKDKIARRASDRIKQLTDQPSKANPDELKKRFGGE